MAPNRYDEQNYQGDKELLGGAYQESQNSQDFQEFQDFQDFQGSPDELQEQDQGAFYAYEREDRPRAYDQPIYYGDEEESGGLPENRKRPLYLWIILPLLLLLILIVSLIWKFTQARDPFAAALEQGQRSQVLSYLDKGQGQIQDERTQDFLRRSLKEISTEYKAGKLDAKEAGDLLAKVKSYLVSEEDAKQADIYIKEIQRAVTQNAAEEALKAARDFAAKKDYIAALKQLEAVKKDSSLYAEAEKLSQQYAKEVFGQIKTTLEQSVQNKDLDQARKYLESNRQLVSAEQYKELEKLIPAESKATDSQGGEQPRQTEQAQSEAGQASESQAANKSEDQASQDQQSRLDRLRGHGQELLEAERYDQLIDLVDEQSAADQAQLRDLRDKAYIRWLKNIQERTEAALAAGDADTALAVLDESYMYMAEDSRYLKLLDKAKKLKADQAKASASQPEQPAFTAGRKGHGLENMNLREAPTQRSAVVGTLDIGQEFVLLDVDVPDNPVWYYVQVGEQKGWVCARAGDRYFVQLDN